MNVMTRNVLLLAACREMLIATTFADTAWLARHRRQPVAAHQID